MPNSGHKKSVELPADLVDRVEERVPHTEFENTADYISYVLEEVLYHVEREVHEETEGVDEQEVQDRLRSLGYLEE